MKVDAYIDYGEEINDYGGTTRTVSATCSECGAVGEAYGDSERSKRAALAKLREACKNGDQNWFEPTTRPSTWECPRCKKVTTYRGAEEPGFCEHCGHIDDSDDPLFADPELQFWYEEWCDHFNLDPIEEDERFIEEQVNEYTTNPRHDLYDVVADAAQRREDRRVDEMAEEWVAAGEEYRATTDGDDPNDESGEEDHSGLNDFL